LRNSDKSNFSKKEILKVITRYCSREEHCISEIHKKLTYYNLSEKDKTEIVNYLKQEKYIDEFRYASAFVNDKFRFNKWGKFKISYELKKKQIPDIIISETIENIPEEDYRNMLNNELSNKLRTLPKLSNYELKAKLYRFAAGRGFENDLILELINKTL